eukprot:6665839-Heterocapsa_arctica.AAC.1
MTRIALEQAMVELDNAAEGSQSSTGHSGSSQTRIALEQAMVELDNAAEGSRSSTGHDRSSHAATLLEDRPPVRPEVKPE